MLQNPNSIEPNTIQYASAVVSSSQHKTPLESPVIRELIQNGAAIHLLWPKTKKPVKPRWSEEPVYSFEELAESYRPGYNLGIRLGVSKIHGQCLYAIDLDIRDKAATPNALTALAQFLPEFGKPPAVASGSGGDSRHFYFVSPALVRSKKLAHSAEKVTGADGRQHWAWEIELFGTGKQVVLPPSVHPDTGQPYRWIRDIDCFVIEVGCGPEIEAERLLSWAPVSAVAGDGDDGEDDGDLQAYLRMQPMDLSAAEIQDTLARLPLADWCDDRDGWLKVGMALHHQYQGSADGLAVWNVFSKQSDKFDATDQNRVWKSFRVTSKSTRFATLIKAANKANPPPGANDDDDLLGSCDPALAPAKPSVEDFGVGGDLTYGNLFASRYAAGFRCILAKSKERDDWVRWDGSRWAGCRAGEHIEAGKALASDILGEATNRLRRSHTPRNEKQHKDAVALFKSQPRIYAMISMARTDARLVATPAQFDVNTWLLGVRNGVLDLKTGRLSPPQAGQMIRKQAPVRFDVSATAPRWGEFLNRIQPDEEFRAFLQRAVGYTLTGEVTEEKLFFCHGVGANGKSVFANVLAALLGPEDYAVTVGAKLLTKSPNSSEADRLVNRLPGARLALANETSQSDVWDDQRIKELASRERISARPLYLEPYDFMPTHKLWIRGNHLPGAHDAGEGFWRRLVPIPFSVQIPEAERVPDLDQRIIETELPGVLNWALAGCLAWQRDGLAIPAHLKRATADYRAETDILGEWLAESTEADPSARTRIGDLFSDFLHHCRGANITAPAMVAFSRQMKERGWEVSGSKRGGRKIPGIRLHRDFSDDFSDPLEL